MTNLRESRFYDLLPPNLQTPKTRAISYAFDRQMRELADYIPITLTLALVGDMREALCDQVALNYNIAEYRPDMDLATKRELIKLTFQVDSRRGTNWAVEKLVSTVFRASAEVEEFFDYGGDPYFFRVVSNHIPQSAAELEDVLERINAAKNVRSWLEALILELRSAGTVYTGMAYHDVANETYRLTSDVTEISPPPVPACAGIAYHDVAVETYRLIGGDA